MRERSRDRDVYDQIVSGQQAERRFYDRALDAAAGHGSGKIALPIHDHLTSLR